MKFKITKASDRSYVEYKEFSSLEELVNYSKELKREFILETLDWKSIPHIYPELMIYDGYVE